MTSQHQQSHSPANPPSASVWQQIEVPLTAIVGLAGLLLDRSREASAGARNEIIEQLASRAQIVHHVVNNALIANRLAERDIKFRTETVPIRPLVESAAEEWAKAHGARVSVSGEVDAIGDPEWIAVALRNALEDAHARGCRNLEVRLSESYRQVTIQIDDDGTNIPEPDLEAFKVSYHRTLAADWRTPDLSLGVVVARGLLKGMGGEVELFRSDDANTCEMTLNRSQEKSRDRRGRIPTRAIDPQDNQPSRDDILALLHEGKVSMAYQSVVSLRRPAGQPPVATGYEAFARFPYASPPEWFRHAGSVGVGTDLELLAIRAGIDGFACQEDDTFLALNLSNSTLLSPRLGDALDGVDPGRVVLELSDTARIQSYQVTRRAVDSLRERGIRLAVDDVGAGEIDMWHILRLAPEVLKLDRQLIADQENVRRNNALIKGLAVMAADLGVMVIAEAVETENEQARLLDLGVEWGQGYLFGKPEPLLWKTRVLSS